MHAEDRTGEPVAGKAVAPEHGCAWVTGASSGIGAAVAVRLARVGWQVATSARNQGRLVELASAPVGPGLGGRSPGRFHPEPADVTDLAAVKAAVARIEGEVAPIALAILNAGTYQPDDAATFDSSAFRSQVELNLMGTVHCLEAVLPAMIARGRGQIAVVSSVAGYRGLPRAAAYGATKAALINMAESLKFGLDRAGVKIQVINPGFVKTPLTDTNDFPMPFIISADEAAERIVRGLARDQFEICFPRRFAVMLKVLRCLPYRLYFPLIAGKTGR